MIIICDAGVPWTEEEHRMFLLGLQKLGKGDWRGISRNYVISRTPTQVASHAQKYFIRQSNVSRRKRRSSLFDIVAEEVSILVFHYLYGNLFLHAYVHPQVRFKTSKRIGHKLSLAFLSLFVNNMEPRCYPKFLFLQIAIFVTFFTFFNPCIISEYSFYSFSFTLQSVDVPMGSRDFFTVNEQQPETEVNDALQPPVVDEECESMDSTNSNNGDSAPPKPEISPSQSSYPMIYPAYFSPFFPLSFPLWTTGFGADNSTKETHEVLKPMAVHSKSPINVDELVGMSKLSLGDSIGNTGPSSLSLKLLEGSSSRQSAFHANPASSTSRMNSSIVS